MKHKTWFRLVLKAIGVLLMAFSAPHLIWAIAAALIEALVTAAPAPGSAMPSYVNWDYEWRFILTQGIELALGLYLFFGGEWVVNKAVPSNRPYCADCGYDLSKSAGLNCPECGAKLPPTEGDA